MSYELTPADAASITDVELAFSTERFLPKQEDIPAEFWEGNLYTGLVDALFAGAPLPDLQIEMKPGFEVEHLQRAVRAHLQSFGPSHEHKIAGIAYMLSKMATLTPSQSPAARP